MATRSTFNMTETPPPHYQPQHHHQHHQHHQHQRDQEQEQLITQARHLTSVASASGVMLPASSPAFSFPVEGGNVTPQQSGQGERASGTAATAIDAQPSSFDVLPSAREFSHPNCLGEANVIFDKGRTDAGQPAVVMNSSVDTTASTSPYSSSGEVSAIIGGPIGEGTTHVVTTKASSLFWWGWNLDGLPNEILMHILGFLEVSDLLVTSRINHHFRTLSLHPVLHTYRLRRARTALPPLLDLTVPPHAPELASRHIFLTQNTVLSRRLARNFAEIGLKQRLRRRPSASALVERGVLPPECVHGSPVAPGLVAKKRAVEKEKIKDGLRRWVGAVWRGEVRERAEGVRRYEEHAGVGRVWRLRRFWERVGRGEDGM